MVRINIVWAVFLSVGFFFMIVSINQSTWATVENVPITYKPRPNVPIDKKYYQNLKKICRAKQSIACCESSVKVMQQGNYILAPSTGCPEGYHRNRLRCIDSFVWCELGL